MGPDEPDCVALSREVHRAGPRTGPDGSGQAMRSIWVDFQAKPLIVDPFGLNFMFWDQTGILVRHDWDLAKAWLQHWHLNLALKLGIQHWHLTLAFDINI